MGNMHIVTGFKGENHVTAADMGSLNAAIFGTGSYVLNRGNKLKATTVSNNKIRISDGDLLIQGRHVRLNEGLYVDLAIENGSQGYKRNDLIVARYTKDSTSGIEDVNLVVIKGTPSASIPADPAYTSGDIINNHVYLSDMPLYRVPLDGLNVNTLVQLFTVNELGIPDSSVTANKLKDKSVTTEKIDNKAVTGDKIADNTVTFSKIKENVVLSLDQIIAATSLDQKLPNAQSVKDIFSKLSDFIIVEQFTLSEKFALAPDQSILKNVPVTVPNGYKAIAVVGLSPVGSPIQTSTTANVFGKTEPFNVPVWVLNVRTSQVSLTFINVNVLFMKI